MSKLNEKLPRKLANQTLQKYEKVHILKVFNENFANQTPQVIVIELIYTLVHCIKKMRLPLHIKIQAF